MLVFLIFSCRRNHIVAVFGTVLAKMEREVTAFGAMVMDGKFWQRIRRPERLAGFLIFGPVSGCRVIPGDLTIHLQGYHPHHPAHRRLYR